MERIKKYLSAWDVTRVVRLVLAGALAVGYFYNKETIYLMGASILGLQAILNISCPGGSCSTSTSKTSDPVIKVEKYDPKK